MKDDDCTEDEENCEEQWDRAYERCDELERSGAPRGGRRELSVFICSEPDFSLS